MKYIGALQGLKAAKPAPSNGNGNGLVQVGS